MTRAIESPAGGNGSNPGAPAPPAVIEGRIITGRPRCGAVAASCECRESPGHYPGTPHLCTPECGGSWRGEETAGDFEVISYPFSADPDVLIASVLQWISGNDGTE
jgi:hypothetical protein